MGRVYLPFDEWPAADKEAWAKAIEAGDVLDGRGPAHHWRPATRHTNERHYARWLGFLQAGGLMDGNPAARVNKPNVKAFVEHLKPTIAPRTVVSSLVGLKVMMKAMAPQVNWRWLEDICNRLNRNAQPSKDKRANMLDSADIFRKTLRHLDQLTKTDLSQRKQLVGFRNSLMVALMTAHPLRRKNFADLTIGSTMLPLDKGWLIKIPGPQTKTGHPIQLEVSRRLFPYIQTYLERVRKRIAQSGETAFWVSWDGDKMPYHMVYISFTRITKELFGKAINPHLFRDCAATTLASRSLKAAMAAPGLLGHRRAETTQRYYIHADQLEASRSMNSLLLSLSTSEARPQKP